MATVTFTYSVTDEANQQEYTWNNVNLGTPSADRYIVVSAFSNHGGCHTTAIDIGGIAANKIAVSTNTASSEDCSLWWALVPTGTTATIIHDHSVTSSGMAGIAVWAVTGVKGVFDVDSIRGTGTPVTGTVNAPTGAPVISALADFDATVKSVNVGTKDYDDVIQSNQDQAGSSDIVATEDTSYDVIWTLTSTTENILTVVSFEPLREGPATLRTELVASPKTGMWELIETQSADDVATLDVINLSSTYFIYKFVWYGLDSRTNAALLYMRTSTDNGVTWDAGVSDYAWVTHEVSMATSPAHNVVGDAADSEIQINPAAGEAYNEYADFEITMFNPSATEFTKFKWEGMMYNTSGVAFHQMGAGMRLSAADVTGVRFLYSSGNVATGLLKVYGIRAS